MAVLVAVVAAALAIPMAVVVSNDQRAAFISNLEVDTLTTAATMSARVRRRPARASRVVSSPSSICR